MTILIASNNPKKLRELSDILQTLGVRAVSLSQSGVKSNPEENGATFEENALIKAMSAARASGMWAVADDSGLVVDALGGQPGVNSARFGGEGLSDAGRNALLLRLLDGVPEGRRGARFVSAVALATPKGRHFTVGGECRGSILTAPSGTGGFGYDPLFYLPEYGMTFAELPGGLKNRISHRARALAEFCGRLGIFIDETKRAESARQTMGCDDMEKQCMTGKNRARLRAMANSLPPLYQIGKGGVTEQVIRQTGEALEARELIKLSVLETSPVSAREAADILCGALCAEPVQVIGSKLVLYRQSKNKRKIFLEE